MLSPLTKGPSRICRANGFSSCCWIGIATGRKVATLQTILPDADGLQGGAGKVGGFSLPSSQPWCRHRARI